MRQKCSQGSFTVEASLIMPIVIFVIISLIYMGFYMHDVAYLQSVANNASMKSAKAMAYKNREIDEGNIVYSDIDDRVNIYWRFSNKSYREIESSVKAYIVEKIGSKCFGVPMNKDSALSNINIKLIKERVMNKYITIQLESNFQTPFDFIPRLLNGGEELKITVKSKSVMPDASEFIRNTTLIDQISDDVKVLREAKNIYEKYVNEVIETLKK
ncbi:MAG: TadE family protein [Eubacteriales bacterium]